MVSDGGIRGFLLICLNAAVKYLEVAIIMSVAVAVGMMGLWETKRHFFRCELNWWQVSQFDGNNNSQTGADVPSVEFMWIP